MELAQQSRAEQMSLPEDDIIANDVDPWPLQPTETTAFDWQLYQKPPEVLAHLQSQQILVDLVLATDDGVSLPVHLPIVAALSNQFFEAIALKRNADDCPEIEIDGQLVKKVAIEGADGEILKSVVYYAYTGRLVMLEAAVPRMMAFANRFQMSDILNDCCSYLVTQLDVSGCVVLYYIGLKQKHKLAAAAWNFIKTHFEKVLNSCPDFVILTESDLVELLLDDELNISDEDSVWHAIKTWCRRDSDTRGPALRGLLTTLRFGRMSEQAFSEMLNDSLVSKTKANVDLLHEFIKKRHKFKDFDGFGLPVGVGNKSCRPRTPNQVIVAIGGWQSGVPSTMVETYDSRTNLWFKSKTSHDYPRAYHGVEVIDGILYLIGGTNGTEILNSVHCFNMSTGKWYQLANLIEPRCYVSTALVDDRIYALGGHNGLLRTDSCEFYNVKTNVWRRMRAMTVPRSDACAAVLGRRIYVAGGLNEQLIEQSVEFYDVDTRIWTLVQQMNMPRTSFSLVTFQGSLFAIGGNNGLERLKLVERYDPRENQWMDEPEMLSRRSTFKACVMDDSIYVVGGYNGLQPFNLVEKFDPETRTWQRLACMNYERSGLSVTVVGGLLNTADYTFNGHARKNSKNVGDLPTDQN